MAKKEAMSPDRRRLAQATGVALGIAILLLVAIVLPAEYGMDPTGFGRFTGLSALADPGGPTAEPSNVTTQFAYQATWTTNETVLAPQTGYAKAGSKRSIGLQLQTPNLTRVTARLTWTDANQTGANPTEPDTFELSVRSPDGRVGDARMARNPQPGGAGTIDVTVTWRQPPTPTRIVAPDAATALAYAWEAEPDDRSSYGSWQINVSLVHAGGARVGGQPVEAGPVDDGNDWRLAFLTQAYQLDAEALAAALVRTDTVHILVPAGKGLEFKIHANQSQLLEYRWASGETPLYYDFHGEPDAASDGTSRTHKEGIAARDTGTLPLPFTGRHGWYWENRGRTDATVSLTLEGVYTLIGLV